MNDAFLTQAFHLERPCGHDQSRGAGRPAAPQAALRDVRPDCRGKEQLAPGVTDHGLVRLQHGQVGGRIAATVRLASSWCRRLVRMEPPRRGAQCSTSFSAMIATPMIAERCRPQRSRHAAAQGSTRRPRGEQREDRDESAFDDGQLE